MNDSELNDLLREWKAPDAPASLDRKVLPKADIMLLFRQSQVHAIEALTNFDMRLWDGDTLVAYATQVSFFTFLD